MWHPQTDVKNWVLSFERHAMIWEPDTSRSIIHVNGAHETGWFQCEYEFLASERVGLRSCSYARRPPTRVGRRRGEREELSADVVVVSVPR